VLEKGGRGLGFNIRGGTDNRFLRDDPGIFVTTIKPDGAAAKDGRLQRGDKILEINGEDVRNVKHFEAVQLFHRSKERVTLLIQKGIAPSQEPEDTLGEYPTTVPSTFKDRLFPVLVIGLGVVGGLLLFRYLYQHR
jgi:C-terminal processing protease CtpA/Prc